MKYKVGDKVKIKSLYWYNTFKDDEGLVDCGQWCFDKKMSRFCGKIVTICGVDDMFNWYRISEETNPHVKYNNNMIEGLADEENPNIMISLEDACDWLWDEIYPRIDDDRIRDILMDDSYRANLVDAFKTAMIKKYNK